LNTPNSDLPVILGHFLFSIVQDGTKDFTKPVGTGPFKVTEFSPGIRSIHSRNQHYWGESRPYLDELEIFVIPDPAVRANALISGEVEYVCSIDSKAIPLIEHAKGVSLTNAPSGSYSAIVVMTDRGPGRSNDFRLGLKYLQNRAAVIAGAYGSNATIGNDQPINSLYADYCADVPQRPFDPDKAKFHLRKSGVDEAVIHVAEVGAGITDTCLLLQNEANKIGFKLNIQNVPLDGYYSNTWQKADISVTRWQMKPTANIIYAQGFIPAAFNDSHWSNERMIQLVNLLRAERDSEKRKQLHCEAQNLIHEESGIILPAFYNFVDGKADKLKGLTSIPIASAGGLQWPEFVWLEA
jgi:peptide/nickel transport system substrate-binding protein